MGATRRRVVVAAVLVLSACSSSGGGSSKGTEAGAIPSPTAGSGPVATPSGPPKVELISEAVSKLEAQLGAPQDYFEINATSKLVNLFVALNDGKLVQPWVYLDGDLSSTDPREASGFTFKATALDFDATRVLSHIETELPNSNPDAFFVEAGSGGVVRYSVTVESAQGGQLVVVVGADGAVQSVDT